MEKISEGSSPKSTPKTEDPFNSEELPVSSTLPEPTLFEKEHSGMLGPREKIYLSFEIEHSDKRIVVTCSPGLGDVIMYISQSETHPSLYNCSWSAGIFFHQPELLRSDTYCLFDADPFYIDKKKRGLCYSTNIDRPLPSSGDLEPVDTCFVRMRGKNYVLQSTKENEEDEKEDEEVRKRKLVGSLY